MAEGIPIRSENLHLDFPVVLVQPFRQVKTLGMFRRYQGDQDQLQFAEPVKSFHGSIVKKHPTLYSQGFDDFDDMVHLASIGVIDRLDGQIQPEADYHQDHNKHQNTVA